MKMPYQQRQADFNESMYAMYLTFEIQRWLYEQGDLVGVAITPTLREEADLGYDAAIPRQWAILYLQFKVPQYLRRPHANEFHVFGEPYFRFAVKTDATNNGMVQHNVLCDLEATGADVFYASPCFLTNDELFQHAFNDGMYQNSVFPRPSQLGPVDEGSDHCYAYTSSLDVRSFSEPGPPKNASFELVRKAVSASVETAELENLGRFLEREISKLRKNESGSTRDRFADDGHELQELGLRASQAGVLPFLVARR